MAATVSVVVVAYETGPILVRCLESLEWGGVDGLQVVLVNNGSDTTEVAEAARMSGVELVSPGKNLGFPGGCNLGAARASGDVLVFLNPDTVVAAGALAELARTLEDRSIGIAMPRLRLLDEPERLNSAGNVLHLAGFAWAGDYGEPADGATELRDVAYASGAALAIHRDTFRDLGGFTEELFLYQEDLDLGWRARLRGLRIVMTPRADVYHDYDYSRHARKNYFLERNRLVFVSAAYSPRLLVAVAPVLVGAELSVLALALKERWLGDKAAGWAWCVRNRAFLARHRREVQEGRRVSDRELTRFLTPTIDPGMTDAPLVARVVNPVVAAYWSLVRCAL